MTKQESKLLSEITKDMKIWIRRPFNLSKILTLYDANCYNPEMLLQHLLLWIDRNNKNKDTQ